MNERTFHGEIERLRDPKRVALLEVERVVALTLEGIEAKNVLDVGIGSGIFAQAFQAHGLAVAGVDTNPEMVIAASEYVPGGEVRLAAAESIPYSDRSFDLVFLGHVLHEADDPVKALSEARRVAQKRVAVLEWPYREEAVGPPLAHRLKPAHVMALAQESGFAGCETMLLEHMVLFRLAL
jgi:ubiquinone/menaquinone biosynthesis C-methylase UbiE